MSDHSRVANSERHSISDGTNPNVGNIGASPDDSAARKKPKLTDEDKSAFAETKDGPMSFPGSSNSQIDGIRLLGLVAEREVIEEGSDEDYDPQQTGNGAAKGDLKPPLEGIKRQPYKPRKSHGPNGSKAALKAGKAPCQFCGASETTEWRKGPDGTKSLCNACGLYYAKVLKKEKQIPINPNPKPINLTNLLLTDDESELRPQRPYSSYKPEYSNRAESERPESDVSQRHITAPTPSFVPRDAFFIPPAVHPGFNPTLQMLASLPSIPVVAPSSPTTTSPKPLSNPSTPPPSGQTQ